MSENNLKESSLLIMSLNQVTVLFLFLGWQQENV